MLKKLSKFCLVLIWMGDQNYWVVPVSHEDKWGNTVECGHHKICQGEVEQEIVCYAPHTPMC